MSNSDNEFRTHPPKGLEEACHMPKKDVQGRSLQVELPPQGTTTKWGHILMLDLVWRQLETR
jgi:hypothetical protein